MSNDQISIDPHVSSPLYLQLKQAIIAQIEAGVYKAGDQLPSERELRDRYKISRHTVRQAIGELVLQGALYRQPGKGTFVRPRERLIGSVHITSASNMIFDWTKQPILWLGVRRVEQAPQFVSSLLEITPGERVVFLESAHVYQGDPIRYFKSWVPYDFGQALLSSPYSDASIMDMMLKRCGVEVRISQDRLEAGIAGYKEASVLCIPEGSAVQVVTGRLLSNTERPVEAHKSIIRGSHFHLEFESRIGPLADNKEGEEKNA